MFANDALARPMRSDSPPSWPGALWVGVVDQDLPEADRLRLLGSQGYQRARLLVREDGLVRGFVEVAVEDHSVDVAGLRSAIAGLDSARPAPADPPLPTMSVVIGTRDRPDQLEVALDSVLALDYPRFDVIVVDNASDGPETIGVVERLAASSPVDLRCVGEPRPGLANARNTGLRAASGEVVAFTDDDVVVDPLWLRRLADGFARSPDVACVTGLVPSGEVRTPVQAYFEQRVSWASSCRSREFSLRLPPRDVPLFPFQVGLFGTGANFAMRREDAFALGGFDEAFGVGSPTRGGEDIDMFVRVIVGGHSLAFEPSAIVWHRHRSDLAALEHQAIGYGTGLGAWLTKVALDRSMNALALRRAVAGLRRARELAAPAPAASDPRIDATTRSALRTVGRVERKGVLAGPASYRRARKAGLLARPLAADAHVRAAAR